MDKEGSDTQKRLYILKAMLLSLLLILTCCFEVTAIETGAENADEMTEPGLPVRYDSRDAGKGPCVKSQGEVNTCWALTATSALEAVLLPEDDMVFSAEHMVYHNGFTAEISDGGDAHMIMAYLSGWYGPVLEEDDPYGDGGTDPDTPVAAHVLEMRLLKGKVRDDFKEAIRSSGSVQTSLFMNRKMTAEDKEYYNPGTSAYYYPVKKTPTHDVLILGWDDEFPRDAFRTDPGEDGAWICQNTWGEDFGSGGIFYVSYADPNIAASGLVYPRVVPALDDVCTRIYQADRCGWQGRTGYDQPDCFFANVFTAQQDEELKAAGFYSVGEKTSYEIYIVHDFKDEASFIHRKFLAKGELDGIGYFTVGFSNRAEMLEKGERFAVMVNIHTEGEDKPVAMELMKDQYTQTVTLEGKESYISLYGGSWEKTQESCQANVCLKAYTGEAESPMP